MAHRSRVKYGSLVVRFRIHDFWKIDLTARTFYIRPYLYLLFFLLCAGPGASGATPQNLFRPGGARILCEHS